MASEYDWARWVDGEHERRRPGCFAYCHVDAAFCPLCHLKSGSGADAAEEAASVSLWRWQDVEAGTAYAADWGSKPGPGALADGEGKTLDKLPECSWGWADRQKREIDGAAADAFSPFSCWGDGSGFEYDIMPENLVGPPGPMAGLYELRGWGVSHSALALGAWNAWAEKFAPDFRFAQVSDLNAETVLFPDVEDPWMFSEYVFRGIGAAGPAGEGGDVVVEPELWDEATLLLANGDCMVEADPAESAEARAAAGLAEEPGVPAAGRSGQESKYGDRGRHRRMRIVTGWERLGLSGGYSGGQGVSEAGGRLFCAEINVASVKWGEHGNVPPGTLDMGGPAAWFEPSSQISAIRPTVICHVGRPYHARTHGIAKWETTGAMENDCLIAPVADLVAEGMTVDRRTGADGIPYFSYPADIGDNGVYQNLPRQQIDRDSSLTNLSYSLLERRVENGGWVHGGCRFCAGTAGGGESGRGELRCTAMAGASAADLAHLKEQFAWEKCTATGGNGKCRRNIPGPEWPVIAVYAARATDLAAKREALLGIYSGEGASERLFADSMLGDFGAGAMQWSLMGGSAYGRPDVYSLENEQVSVWYEVEFGIERRGSAAVRTAGKEDGGEFGRGVEVVRGSGTAALDTAEHADAFRGDAVCFDDMDQRGFARWFEMPMFCADPAYCNDTCGFGMRAGYTPGLPAGDSKNGECRYYRSALWGGTNGKIGCPLDCVQKRAREFQEAITRCSATIESLARLWLNLPDDSARAEYDFATAGPYYFAPLELESPGLVEAWDIYAEDEDIGKTLGGIEAKETLEVARKPAGSQTARTWKGYRFARFGVFKKGAPRAADEPGAASIKPVGGTGGSYGPEYLKDKEVRCFFWYVPRQNDGTAGYVDCAGKRTDMWFVRTDPAWHKFSRNALIVTNAAKFIGGYHPQYKDYGRIGPEFIQEVESDAYRDAAGDIIGDVDNDGAPQATNRQGYWTDADGDYITDERPTGVGAWGTGEDAQEIGDDEGRKNAGSPACISFRKSNTVIDVANGTNKGPKVINCAVRANDSLGALDKLRKRGPEYDDPDGFNAKYKAPPSVADKYAIPTMRRAARCPKCDYYLAWKYHDMVCPWCGSRLEGVSGDPGEGMDVGSAWDKDASVIRKFFKLNAIGRVQVWAPAGTAVPRDGYFWKSPALVRNTLLWQIKRRLGDYAAGRAVTDRTGKVVSQAGGAWRLNWMSREAEMTLGLPEQIGEYSPLPSYVAPEAGGDPADGFAARLLQLEWTGVTAADRAKYASGNALSPKALIPGIQGDRADEAIIAPYTAASHDSLKMASAKHLRMLRNRIEPWLAYTSDAPAGGDFPRTRATYEDRLSDAVPRYSPKGHCRADAVIRAANDTGVDSFVQFWSGDYSWGSVREYYPPGLSWWWLNNVIGGRYSDNTGGQFHMDSGSKSGGHRTVAKAAVFLHGLLPLDKEIMKAYLILYPAGEPSKEPIGRDWQGMIKYEHYHAFTERHFDDGAVAHLHGQAGTEWMYDSEGVVHYDWGDPTASGGQVVPLSDDAKAAGGRAAERGFPPPQARTRREETAKRENARNAPLPRDTGDYRGWGGASSRPGAYRSLFADGFQENWLGLAGVMDVGFWKQAGLVAREYDAASGLYKYPMAKETSAGDWTPGLRNAGLYYNAKCPPEERVAEKFRAVGFAAAGETPSADGWGEAPEIPFAAMDPNANWGEMTAAELAAAIERYTVEVAFTASDGDPASEATATFTQTATAFSGGIFPRQSQNIAGYLDVGGLNSAGLLRTYMVGQQDADGSSGEIVLAEAAGETTREIVAQSVWYKGTDHEITYTRWVEKDSDGNVVGRGWNCVGTGRNANGAASPVHYRSVADSATGSAASGGGTTAFGGGMGSSGYNSGTNSGGGGYSGTYGGHSNDAGAQPRCLDVTDLVRKQYNLRVDRDFACQGGLTLDAMAAKEFGASEWRGVAAQPAWWRNESLRWNSRIADSAFTGYLLNDGSSFPALEASGALPEIPAAGDQYPLAGGEIVITASFRLPVAVTALNRNWTAKRDEGEAESGQLAIGSLATGTAVVAALKEIFGAAYEITAPSDTAAVIRRTGLDTTGEAASAKGIELVATANACYGLFGLSAGKWTARQSRVRACTGSSGGHSPDRLDAGGSWHYRSYSDATMAAVFDLARAPLEAWTRDYRAQRPTTDVTGVVCPHCYPGGNGLTVGQYNERYKKYSPAGSTACPSCGRDLTGQPGASGTPGDGLRTWGYAAPFAEAPYITGVRVAGVNPGQGFRVSCRGDALGEWRPLIDAWCNPQTGQYTWHSFDGQGGRETAYESLPADFVFEKGKWPRARFVRLEGIPQCLPELLAFDSFGACTPYSLEIPGNFAEYGGLPWRGLECTIEYADREALTLPLLTAEVAADSAKLTLYFDYLLPKDVTPKRIALSPKCFVGAFAQFEVYGFHYTADDLKVTGPADEKVARFTTDRHYIQLDEYPTQILGVTLTGPALGGVELVEEPDANAPLLYDLAVVGVPIDASNAGFAYRITGGKWHFDHLHNRILLPSAGKCAEEGEDSGAEIQDYAFEKDTESNIYGISYYPAKVIVRYWAGSGKEIELEATAADSGPSYQLETGAIRQIVGGDLPDNGESNLLPDAQGAFAKRKIPWTCTSLTPATLEYGTQVLTGGKFLPPKLSTTVLGKAVDNDRAFRDLFGEHCERLKGYCHTTVLFRGAPDQVLSGALTVRAPAYDTRVIDAGERRVLRERTGGLAGGVIIVKAEIQPGKGRKTLAFSPPQLLIYARDRDPEDELLPPTGGGSSAQAGGSGIEGEGG